jgi:hypothetical protein
MSDLSDKTEEDRRTILLDWSEIPVHFLNASNKRYRLNQLSEGIVIIIIIIIITSSSPKRPHDSGARPSSYSVGTVFPSWG